MHFRNPGRKVIWQLTMEQDGNVKTYVQICALLKMELGSPIFLKFTTTNFLTTGRKNTTKFKIKTSEIKQSAQ